MWKKDKDHNNLEEKNKRDSKTYKKLKKVAIIIGSAIIILGSSFAIGLGLGGSSVNKSLAVNKTEVKEKNESKDMEMENKEKDYTEKAADNEYNVEQLYYEVHLRVNTIIIAEDDEVWEVIEIDRNFLNNTVPLLKGKDDYLYKELLKWNDLDFSTSVEIHNYVWEKLGGTVGKSIGINEESVAKLKEKLSL